jgi:hypothetical protein
MQFRTLGFSAVAIGASFLPGAAGAQTLDLSVTIPQLKVAEYHRPYVAITIQKEGGAVHTIAVWYQTGRASKEGEGTKWLRDIRGWWRAAGRTMKFPADGITGATRSPGTHKLRFVGGKGGMPVLTPGKYKLVVESAREVGGRDVVSVPFDWSGGTASAQGKGSAELGAIALTVKR